MKLCMNLCLAAVFIRIIWTDIRTMTIPDNVLVPLVILAAMSVPAEPEISLTARIIGCFSVALPMYITDRFIDGAFSVGCVATLTSVHSAAGISDFWQLWDFISDGRCAWWGQLQDSFSADFRL